MTDFNLDKRFSVALKELDCFTDHSLVGIVLEDRGWDGAGRDDTFFHIAGCEVPVSLRGSHKAMEALAAFAARYVVVMEPNFAVGGDAWDMGADEIRESLDWARPVIEARVGEFLVDAALPASSAVRVAAVPAP